MSHTLKVPEKAKALSCANCGIDVVLFPSNIGAENLYTCPCGKKHFLVAIPNQVLDELHESKKYLQERNKGLKQEIASERELNASHQRERDKWLDRIIHLQQVVVDEAVYDGK